jgi:hypothetical protein
VPAENLIPSVRLRHPVHPGGAAAFSVCDDVEKPMGEYGTFNGQRIKIGTCEDMYYLRADQIHLVQSPTLRDVTCLRFRFPFPDEDQIDPGDFDEHDRGLTVWGYGIPDGVKHYSVQVTTSAGILVSLPCPYSSAAAESGITYHFNGFRGPARIVQQRVWAGVWATVMACGPCGAKYRLPDLDSATSLLDILDAHATQADRDENRSLADMWRTIAVRVKAGYHTPTGLDPDADPV